MSEVTRPMNIDLLLGLPGSGKSTLMRSEAAAAPDRYVFMASSIDLIEETCEALRREAPKASITPIHHKNKRKGSVQEQLDQEAERTEEEGIEHAIVAITHESMMDKNLGKFAGWQARIDEAPNALASGVIKAPASAALLDQLLHLEPIDGTGWAQVRTKIDLPSWRQRSSDTLIKDLSEFLKLVERPQGVFVDRHEWSKKFGWCSVWLPTALRHFATCKIASASYPSSLGAVAARQLIPDGLSFRERIVAVQRTAQPLIRLHYFTRSHEGTTNLWDTSAGRRILVPIVDFLSSRSSPLGFWSGNEEAVKLMEHRVLGQPIPPKVAGLNEWRSATSCALIYSSKPLPTDGPAKDLLGITDQEIMRSREEEDIIQFVMRGAIRNHDFGGDYDIYLYSQRQAYTLRDYLLAIGMGASIDLIPEFAVGVMDESPLTVTPITAGLKARSKEARREKRAEYARNARALKATSQGREAGKAGRPTRQPHHATLASETCSNAP